MTDETIPIPTILYRSLTNNKWEEAIENMIVLKNNDDTKELNIIVAKIYPKSVVDLILDYDEDIKNVVSKYKLTLNEFIKDNDVIEYHILENDFKKTIIRIPSKYQCR
jgi:hypothetical protein